MEAHEVHHFRFIGPIHPGPPFLRRSETKIERFVIILLLANQLSPGRDKVGIQDDGQG